jgi:site-specific recombinase XerD
VFWCKYYVNGLPRRESTGKTKEKEAGDFLKVREGRAAAGMPDLPRADRIRYEEAAADLRLHYQTTGTRNMVEAEKRLKHLDPFLTGRKLASIGGADATAYVAHRQAEGVANGTINRELAVLTKMLRLAHEHRKLVRLPVVHKLKEAAPRQGFFERDAFLAVRAALPEDLQVAVSIEYVFGWRTQSEVLPLERRHLDLTAGTIRLDPGMTKNDDGREVYLPADLKVHLAAQVERVRDLERKLGRVIPFLFPHLAGRLAGERRRDFRKVWLTACVKAGLAERVQLAPGKVRIKAHRLRHDFRRTAVRNMVNAGVPERVAMKVTGHRTRAVFDRYHIVSPTDLQDVAAKLTGTLTGTIAPRAASGHLTPVS